MFRRKPSESGFTPEKVARALLSQGDPKPAPRPPSRPNQPKGRSSTSININLGGVSQAVAQVAMWYRDRSEQQRNQLQAQAVDILRLAATRQGVINEMMAAVECSLTPEVVRTHLARFGSEGICLRRYFPDGRDVYVFVEFLPRVRHCGFCEQDSAPEVTGCSFCGAELDTVRVSDAIFRATSSQPPTV